MNLLNYKVSNRTFILLLILLIISFFNVLRFVHYLLFHSSNNNKSTEEILKYIHYEIFFQFLSWFAYLIFFIIFIFINFTQTRNKIYNKIFTFIFLFLIYLPIFPILNIVNIILLLFITNPPFIANIDSEIDFNDTLETNYKTIKNEFIHYNNEKTIDCFRESNPLLSNIDSIDTTNNYCWRTLYLKKTGDIVNDLTSSFPETMELIKNEQIHNAFFSILDPHVEIKPHIGYYKGYLRYHLGIIIPEENDKKPYIICGDEKYEWKEGKGVLFDDMFLHYVNNPTNKQRVVLYLDIKRKNENIFIDLINDLGNYLIENSFIIDLFVKNQHIQTTL